MRSPTAGVRRAIQSSCRCQSWPASPRKPGAASQQTDREPSSTIHPRFQAGIRYSPVSRFDIDLIYGHNIGGEGSQWLTAGFNIRFDAR